MISWSENSTLQLIGFVVSLVTVGLVPYLIAKNTKQHKQGSEERAGQTDILKTLLGNQLDIKEDIGEVKGAIKTIEENKVDKSDFDVLLNRLEREKNEGKAE